MLPADVPWIHTGAYEGARPRGQRYPGTAHTVYALWHLRSGSAELEADALPRQRVIAPAALLLPPMPGLLVRIPAGSVWQHLRFDVVRHAQRPNDDRRGSTPADPGHPQPQPRAIWGLDLPAFVPEPLVASCASLLESCIAIWWRSPLDRLRAGLRLGLWLADLVEFVAMGVTPPTTLGEHLERRLAQQLPMRPRVPQVAAQAGMDRRALTQALRHEDGRTPGRLLHQARLARAEHLLRATDLSCEAIARWCGYRSRSSFSHCFRKATGLSPRAWRRREHLST